MKNKNIYIIASTFYSELSDKLIEGAKTELLSQDKFDSNETKLKIIKVPGAFEIPGITKRILTQTISGKENYILDTVGFSKPDLIITLGVLIKGETNHFEYISESVSHSISQLTISSDIPIIFGVITALNYEQASERALISKKNKGAEVMKTGLEMLKLYDKYKK